MKKLLPFLFACVSCLGIDLSDIEVTVMSSGTATSGFAVAADGSGNLVYSQVDADLSADPLIITGTEISANNATAYFSGLVLNGTPVVASPSDKPKRITIYFHLAGEVTTGQKFGYWLNTTGETYNITYVYCYSQIAPVGDNINTDVFIGGVSESVSQVLINDGNTANANAVVPIAVDSGETVQLSLTSVGSTTPGAYLSVIIELVRVDT